AFHTNNEQDSELVIVQSDSQTVDDPAFRAAAQEMQQRISGLKGIVVGKPVSYFDLQQKNPDQAAGMVSKDRHAALISATLENRDTSTVDDFRASAENPPSGFNVLLAGQGVLAGDFSKIAEQDLKKGETIGIAVALIVLIVVFGAIVAALLPIVMALV